MTKGTTAVFTALVVVPVAFVQHCLLCITVLRVLSSFTHLHLSWAIVPVSYFKAKWKIDTWQGFFFKNSSHSCNTKFTCPWLLVTNNPHNSHRFRDNLSYWYCVAFFPPLHSYTHKISSLLCCLFHCFPAVSELTQVSFSFVLGNRRQSLKCTQRLVWLSSFVVYQHSALYLLFSVSFQCRATLSAGLRKWSWIRSRECWHL